MGKLVRDNIPKIIKENGQKCETCILNDYDYFQALKTKLQEEVNEFLESEEIEELADIEEVLRAILNVKQTSYENLENIRKEKEIKNGAFNNKIFLISVEKQN